MSDTVIISWITNNNELQRRWRRLPITKKAALLKAANGDFTKAREMLADPKK